MSMRGLILGIVDRQAASLKYGLRATGRSKRWLLSDFLNGTHLLLASSGQIGKAFAVMSVSSLTRSLSGMFFAGAILLAGLMSAAPGWHEALHPDAATTTHLCIVTLFAAGHCEAHFGVPIGVTPDQPGLLTTLTVREPPARVKPHFFARLEHAPPAFA